VTEIGVLPLRRKKFVEEARLSGAGFFASLFAADNQDGNRPIILYGKIGSAFFAIF